MAKKTTLGGRYSKELVKIADAYGFTLARAKKHAVWKGPNGETVVTPKTPGCNKTLQATERLFRNALRRSEAG